MSDLEKNLDHDHSKQGFLLKIQYSEDGKQLQHRNQIDSDQHICDFFESKDVLNKNQVKKQESNSPSINKSIQKSGRVAIFIDNQKLVQSDALNTTDYLYQQQGEKYRQSLANLDELDSHTQKESNQNVQQEQEINKIQQNQEEICRKTQYGANKEKIKRYTQTKYQNNFGNQLFEMNLKFITKLRSYAIRFYRNYTASGRTLFLTPEIRQKINDKCDLVETKNKVSLTQQLFNYFSQQVENILPQVNIPLINPQSNVGFFLSLFFTTFNVLFFYIFSLDIIFENQLMALNQINNIGLLIWFIEFIVKLNTLVYDQTQILTYRKDIIKLYLKSQLIYDLFPYILLIIISAQDMNKMSIILKILTCLKIRNIVKDIDNIQTQFCMRASRYYLVQLFNLIFKIFMIAHIIACMWYLLGIFELNVLNEEKTWFNDLVQYTTTWWQLYIYSLFWSLSLMTMGSNTANTVSQTFFTTLIMFFTTITFGYLLNIIGMILQEMDETEKNKRKDINLINEYMRTKNISMQIQFKFPLKVKQNHDFNKFQTVLSSNLSQFR